jgi:hypothetical protein
MIEFNKKIQAKFTAMCSTGKLFRVELTGGEIWDLYLKSFSKENDPVFRDPESTSHNCNHCNNFIRRYGNIVSIDENYKVTTMFDVDIKEGEDYLDIVKFIKSIINEKYLTIIKTNGGFHCLISMIKTKKHPFGDFQDIVFEPTKESDFSTQGKKWYQALQGHPFKSELNIMSHDLMPLVGCNQGKFVPYILI